MNTQLASWKRETVILSVMLITVKVFVNIVARNGSSKSGFFNPRISVKGVLM